MLATKMDRRGKKRRWVGETETKSKQIITRATEMSYVMISLSVWCLEKKIYDLRLTSAALAMPTTAVVNRTRMVESFMVGCWDDYLESRWLFVMVMRCFVMRCCFSVEWDGCYHTLEKIMREIPQSKLQICSDCDLVVLTFVPEHSAWTVIRQQMLRIVDMCMMKGLSVVSRIYNSERL